MGQDLAKAWAFPGYPWFFNACPVNGWERSFPGLLNLTLGLSSAKGVSQFPPLTTAEDGDDQPVSQSGTLQGPCSGLGMWGPLTGLLLAEPPCRTRDMLSRTFSLLPFRLWSRPPNSDPKAPKLPFITSSLLFLQTVDSAVVCLPLGQKAES